MPELGSGLDVVLAPRPYISTVGCTPKTVGRACVTTQSSRFFPTNSAKKKESPKRVNPLIGLASSEFLTCLARGSDRPPAIASSETGYSQQKTPKLIPTLL